MKYAIEFNSSNGYYMIIDTKDCRILHFTSTLEEAYKRIDAIQFKSWNHSMKKGSLLGKEHFIENIVNIYG